MTTIKVCRHCGFEMQLDAGGNAQNVQYLCQNCGKFYIQLNERKLMGKYLFRKKPVSGISWEVEAVQWTGKNAKKIVEWAGAESVFLEKRMGENLIIKTSEGNMSVRKFDFIIKGIYGEFFPCKPHFFEDAYEKVEECPLSSSHNK